MPSKDNIPWHKLRNRFSNPKGGYDPIAPRWRTILEPEWGTLSDKPSSLVVDRSTKQQPIKESLGNSRYLRREAASRDAKVVLHFPSPRIVKAAKRHAALKRKAHSTITLLRVSDAANDKTAIHHISVRCKPLRIRHGRRSTWVEEFLIQWEPERYTVQGN
jgi:hypothetical protein